MIHKLIIYTTAVFILFSTTTKGQALTQTIRGTVLDNVTQTPLPGASVILLNVEPFTGTTTDIDGNFKLTQVLVGKQTLKISFMGYKEMTVPNIIVISGKETVMNLNLEENVIQGKEVVITDKVEKNKPLNEYSTVSSRTFSVEETQKFAAAVNDPGRMASSFAGVVPTDDGNNNIAIRGNSPNGLIWRMEGVEIPNPNHFSNVGTSGGGISILSAQVLSNSDFMTGAFPAEYGNALSGVFDLKLRRGNNQKREYTFQAGLLGLDAAVEGPFKKDYKGSYLINYRYSTLSLLGNLGINVGEGETNFQDLSYNIFLPTNKFGSFSVFGFGGLSTQQYNAKKDSTKWENSYERYNYDLKTLTGATGIIHTASLNSSTFLRTSLSGSISDKTYTEDKLLEDYTTLPQLNQDYTQNKISLSSILTKKINSRHSYKTGIIGSELFYSLHDKEYEITTNTLETLIKQKGNAYTVQAFAQWNYHATEKLSFIGGLHALTFTNNNTYALEPRASAKYEISPVQSISLGYGLHSQIQPLGVYFAQVENADGTFTEPNKKLGFTKAHHAVLSYDRSLTEFLHVKAEVYYQKLFSVPIGTDTDKNLSMLNNDAGFETDPLVNKGEGRNYGLELTVEQFMHHDFYFLLSASFYDSEYKGIKDEWHDTHYNGNYAGSFTAGKEFKTGKGFGNRIVGVNIKTLYSGGLRETPIDLEASIQKGETVLENDKPFSIKNKDYFRTDLKFSVKRNRSHSTVTWSLDIQNATNRQNIYGKYFDPLTGKTKTAYQTSLIPVLSYKIEF